MPHTVRKWSQPVVFTLCYGVLAPAAAAIEPCPANYSEWLRAATVDGATVQVCVSNNEIAGSKQLQLTLNSNTEHRQSVVPLDIEGDLRAITLAPAVYALKPGRRAIALELQLRNRGVSFDEERRDLWLFWPEASQLRLVFNQTMELQHWATNCPQDCDDTVHSRSELRLLPWPATQQKMPAVKPTTGRPITTGSSISTPVDNSPTAAQFRDEFVPLELISQGEVVPGGAEDSKPQPFRHVQQYEFVGERYELMQ